MKDGSRHAAARRFNTLDRVMFATLLLIVALYLGIIVTSIVKGEPLPYVGPGAPPPCSPPDEGIWPDCHPATKK